MIKTIFGRGCKGLLENSAAHVQLAEQMYFCTCDVVVFVDSKFSDGSIAIVRVLYRNPKRKKERGRERERGIEKLEKSRKRQKQLNAV